MSSNKKYYRTVFKIEVLSNEPIGPGIGLEGIAYEISEGNCSGMFLEEAVEECDEKRISELLENQGSDPSFLVEVEEDEDTTWLSPHWWNDSN